MSAANKLVPVVDGTAGTPIELQDARISVTGTPSNHDILMYNSNTQKFENTSFPTIPTVPTNVSSFTNDAGYITSVPEEVLKCIYDWHDHKMYRSDLTAELTVNNILDAQAQKKAVICEADDGIYHITASSIGVAGVNDQPTWRTIRFASINLDNNSISQLKWNNITSVWDKTTYTLPTNISSLTNDAGYITASTAPKEILRCMMIDNTGYYMYDGTTLQEIEDALDHDKVIVCTLVFEINGSSTYVTLTASGYTSTIILSGTSKIGSSYYIFQASYDHTDSASDIEYWNLQYTVIPTTSIVTDASYVHTDNNYTTAEKTKLSGIESGAEVNVQSDWTEDDSTEDSYILHKPVEGNDIEMTDLLPYGYTALDYVSNASNTHIDTGIAPDIDDFEMELVIRPSTGSWYIWQSRPSGGGATTGISGANSGSTITFNFCGTTLTSSITRSTSSTYTIKAKAKNGVVSLYVKKHSDGTEDLKTGTYTYSRQTLPFYLFGNQNNNRVNANNRIYRARMWKGGKLVLDYIPAKDINTNTILLYEAVCGSKTEPTAGTLNAGNAITMPVAIGLKSSICNNTIHAPIEVSSGGTVTETINAAEGNGINTYIVKNGSGNPNTELTLNYIRPEWSCGMRDCIVLDNTDASGNLYVSIEPRVKGYNSTVVYGTSAITVKIGDCAIADVIVSLAGNQVYAVVNVNGIASRKSITFN